MKATVTSIELKGPLKYFLLSSMAMKIMRHLKSTDYADFKNRGIWTEHCTTTLWKSEDEMKKFASSGAHKKAMQSSQRIAKEIRTVAVDLDKLPSWSIAMELLKEGEIIRFE